MTFPCQNSVCGLMLELNDIPAPEVINTQLVSAVLWPVFGVTCTGCGTFHRANIKQAQVKLELTIQPVEKKAEVSNIVKPQWK